MKGLTKKHIYITQTIRGGYPGRKGVGSMEVGRWGAQEWKEAVFGAMGAPGSVQMIFLLSCTLETSVVLPTNVTSTNSII